jgi:predicted Fe-Mo cluster-binding NifX family protein
MMTAHASALPRRTRPIAVLVMGSDGATTLCPFFGKCDGILLVDRGDGSHAFVPNDQRTAEALCDLIHKSGADHLVCGFIGEAEKRKLSAAGIDVRLGSCACSIDELTDGFYDLPKA